MINKIDPEELFGKDYREFCEKDPFNPTNVVEGFISQKTNEYYGSLIITKVNYQPVTPQLIMGSPKMHYPFGIHPDGARNYLFPSCSSIESYTKLDGTNVLAYYYDSPKGRCLTFKTRIRPFLGSGRFGDFLGMWKEIATPHFDRIKMIMHNSNCNLSFEMYGARNPHLILYGVPLAIALLFGVSNTGQIFTPVDLGLARSKDYLAISPLPLVRRLAVHTRDYVWNYEDTQRELEEGLQEAEGGLYTGQEGAVWYLKKASDGRTVQVKLKPGTIEEIHWANDAMTKNAIITTCRNAFENTDYPTLEFINQLLAEEFTEDEVKDNQELIERCLAFVIEDMTFRATVLEAYQQTGMNIAITGKAKVMREMSQHFSGREMKRVYTIIADFA